MYALKLPYFLNEKVITNMRLVTLVWRQFFWKEKHFRFAPEQKKIQIVEKE